MSISKYAIILEKFLLTDFNRFFTFAKAMRIARSVLINSDHPQFFHVISRVVDKKFIFKPQECTVFHKMMRQFESFSGVKVHSYCIMSNHFHLLIQVPKCPAIISEDDIRNRMSYIYSPKKLQEFDEFIQYHREVGNLNVINAFYHGMRKRMYNLSIFIKDLKQKFTRWYNIEHRRKGTLWEERFKSVLIQGCGNTLKKIAAYIELNPVRAGIVKDPGTYKWNSYSEAVSGNNLTRTRISEILLNTPSSDDWDRIHKDYKEYLYFKLSQNNPAKALNNQTDPKPQKSMSQNESIAAALRSRIRYFTDGLVIGNKEFILNFYQLRQHLLCPTRKVPGKPVRGKIWDGLFSYRDVGGSH